MRGYDGTKLLLASVALASAVSVAPAGADPITLVDQAGRTVSLKEPADRVVAIPIPSPPVIAATVGSPDTIVAMHPRAFNSIRIGLLDNMFPEVADIPTDIIRGSGFVPNVEEILKYDSDVVFQWAEEDLGVLENAGLNPIALDTGSADKLETMMAIFGQVHGRTDKVDEIVAWHVETREMLHERSAEIPDAERPGILYFYRFHMGDQNQWVTRGGNLQNGYRTWYMNMIGARNVAAGGAAQIEFTAEQALAWDPEIILLNAYEKEELTGSDLTPQDVYDDPFLSQTRAAKAHRVYKMPVGAVWWDSGNQESPLMWKWAAMLAHPDRFDFPLRDELKERFEFLYGYELSEEEIDGILHVDMHKGAANYERFSG